jgi:hypothetical protein
VPEARDVLLVDERTRPMTFPGTWGLNDKTAFVTWKENLLGPPGSGPRTPSRQPLWTRPLRQIFCGKAWRPKACARDSVQR